MAEAAHRRLVWHRLAAQVDPDKTPYRLISAHIADHGTTRSTSVRNAARRVVLPSIQTPLPPVSVLIPNPMLQSAPVTNYTGIIGSWLSADAHYDRSVLVWRSYRTSGEIALTHVQVCPP